MENSQANNSTNTVWQVIGRLITAGIVLAITAFFTPGFQINNFWALAIATIVLTVIDFLIAKFTGLKASPFGKGFVGFVLSAVVLYITQYFVAGYVISWMAAIIGALIYGVVDYFLPGDQEM
ncbi:MAG: phage holin family protein [Clostridia bacterium]|nr:phage holin family protein [Clostridia bacterium]